MNVICFICLQRISHVINKCAPLLILKGLYGIHQLCALLLWSGLWVKHGEHSSGFSREILFVTFSLAEAARMIGSPWPSIIRHFVLHPQLMTTESIHKGGWQDVGIQELSTHRDCFWVEMCATGSQQHRSLGATFAVVSHVQWELHRGGSSKWTPCFVLTFLWSVMRRLSC